MRRGQKKTKKVMSLPIKNPSFDWGFDISVI
jgi:hypothetical protein